MKLTPCVCQVPWQIAGIPGQLCSSSSRGCFSAAQSLGCDLYSLLLVPAAGDSEDKESIKVPAKNVPKPQEGGDAPIWRVSPAGPELFSLAWTAKCSPRPCP